MEVGLLGKAAALKSPRTPVIQQRCVKRVRLQAVSGKSGGGGRGRGVIAAGSLHTDERCHPLLCTCAQVTSDSSQ